MQKIIIKIILLTIIINVTFMYIFSQFIVDLLCFYLIICYSLVIYSYSKNTLCARPCNIGGGGQCILALVLNTAKKLLIAQVVSMECETRHAASRMNDHIINDRKDA